MMQTINLNDPSQFTRDSVARLIGSVLDTQDWQLRVTEEGIAYLSDIVGNQDVASLAFRLGTWCSGNNYVGFQASHDKTWVDHVLKELQENWPMPLGTYLGT